MKTTNLLSLCAAVGLATAAAPALAGDAEAGKEKAAACAACHGPDGKAILPAYPNLAGQHADYLVAALEQYKSGERQNAIMAGFVQALSEEDMEDIAAYYASMEGLGVLPRD